MRARLHLFRTSLAAGALALSPAVFALSPPPPMPVEVLTEFYEAMNGDHWHRNDGWLDPEVEVCDWYGIRCVTEGEEFGGFEWVGNIRLPDNNLRGELDADLLKRMASHSAAPVPSRVLDLRGNHIEGELPALPAHLDTLRLGFNRLEGELPELDPEAAIDELRYLELNNNAFSGELPPSWADLDLGRLDLSTNQLEGPPGIAFEALDPIHASHVDLSDNAFTGALPAWVIELELSADLGAVGSLNICWTKLTIDNDTVQAWVAERHVGGDDFDDCLNRQRQPIDMTVSGSWFDPERPGEGYSLMMLDNGLPLAYWFTHLSLSRQMWLIGTGDHQDPTIFFRELLKTRGQFGQGLEPGENAMGSKGRLRLDGLPDGRLRQSAHIVYSTGEVAQPDDGPIIHMPNPLDFTTDLARLSQLAGTSCDKQSDFQQYSGAWDNPERSGEGFIVEVLPDDRAVVYWFTYEPGDSGRQAWMIGQSDHIRPAAEICTILCEDTTIEFETMFQPVDTGQTFPGDLSGLETLDWGELRLSFSNEDSGHVWFDSHIEGFGSGDYPIERLARPMLAECQ